MAEYVKSPLNYTGGKYKLLPQIIPYIPQDINTFIDVFGGGFNVGSNILQAKKVVYNDICTELVEFMQYVKENDLDKLLNEIHTLVAQYDLSMTNKDGYLRLREYYNKEYRSPMVLYTLICHAFNYQIRFNKRGEYNMPFGKDRSYFSPTLEGKFVKFKNRLDSMSLNFCNRDFRELDFSTLGKDDFVYLDPPYLSSVASYNEGGQWTSKKEIELLDKLDILNEQGIRFMLSNNLQYDNPYLQDWISKYKVISIDGNYGNCSYHKKNRSKGNEVIIVNY